MTNMKILFIAQLVWSVAITAIGIVKLVAALGTWKKGGDISSIAPRETPDS